MLAPVVKHARDVANPLGPLAQAQDQIVVLAAGKLDAQPTQFLDQRTPVHPKVAGVHSREERVGRPVGFEVRLAVESRLVDLVLIGVEHVDVGIAVDRQRDFKERVGRKRIVVIEKTHELACRQSQCRVARRGDVAVLGAIDHLDARVQCGVLLEYFADVPLFGGVVGDAQLPIGIGLREHRLDRLAQKPFGSLVRRHDHADHHAPRQRLGHLAHPHRVRRTNLIHRQPFLVVARKRRTRTLSEHRFQQHQAIPLGFDNPIDDLVAVGLQLRASQGAWICDDQRGFHATKAHGGSQAANRSAKQCEAAVLNDCIGRPQLLETLPRPRELP